MFRLDCDAAGTAVGIFVAGIAVDDSFLLDVTIRFRIRSVRGSRGSNDDDSRVRADFRYHLDGIYALRRRLY